VDDLDERLRDLRTHLDTGPPPDVATTVVRRLRTEPAPLAVRARRRLVAVVAAAVAAMLTAGLLAVPAVRAAVVEFLSLPGVVFDRDRPQPPSPGATPAGPLGAAYGLNAPISFEEARRAAPERVLAPGGLGPPDEVYVTGGGRRRAFHLFWRATPQLPALPGSSAGLYLSVFGGEAEVMLQKMIGGVPAEELTVAGRPGVWLGTEHGTVLFGPDGLPDYSTERVAGPALLLDRGGFTIRIESHLSRADAVSLAESLR
jgi:hypothetical protein